MNNIIKIIKEIKEISSFSFCEYQKLIIKMSETNIKKVESLCKNPKSVIFMLMPYFAGKQSGNISKYARGQDYHIVSKKLLSKIIIKLKIDYPNNEFIDLCDASPLPEVYGAYISGLGKLGKNKLIFDKKYGSYVFISSIITDLNMKYTTGQKDCTNCNKCVEYCPTGFLSGKGRCLSDITQSKEEVSENEKNLIKNMKIWGCDICSDICPLNKDVQISPNKDFTENLIFNLKTQDIIDLNRREFTQKYYNRAFTFRGPKPILRNLIIKDTKN